VTETHRCERLAQGYSIAVPSAQWRCFAMINKVEKVYWIPIHSNPETLLLLLDMTSVLLIASAAATDPFLSDTGDA